MPNRKMENLLNLALAATPGEREKSLELDIGYDGAEQTWEVIVKFVGTTEDLVALLLENFPREYPRIQLTNLQNEYVVLVLPEHLVEPVAALDKIEYMEKPKLLFFAVDNGKRASCITQLQERTGCRVPVSLWRSLIPASITRIRIFGGRTVRPALSVSGIRRSRVRGLVGAGGVFPWNRVR